ncbi:hypothetical protein CRENPOLYSF1_100031 [Crenothrix polyspora]|uniref:Uncharacterized protein n=1 Tax=Crenothrix polyspora TaxID=360316 RepID=A0A1R4GYU2_9GAMM|nr:hypothetical protein CRENPOLYSF1_100031 [Crenothrix polyspora]
MVKHFATLAKERRKAQKIARNLLNLLIVPIYEINQSLTLLKY